MPSSISSKRSFLKMTWDGMNYFFQSIVNFFNKTFSNISDFLKSSPILFALCGVFLFFFEGCIWFARGLIVESIFNNVYKGASKAYKALRLDELFLKIKQTRYNFCGKETKLKIQVEILVKNIIDQFLENNILEKDENNLKLFVFNYELKTFSELNLDIVNINIKKQSLKQIILDNLKNVQNDNNDKQKFSYNNEQEFSRIVIKLNNSFEKTISKKEIKKDTNELKSADKEKLKKIIVDKIFSSKIRAELSDLIFSELKDSLQQEKTQSSKLTIDQILQNISKKTKFQEKNT